MLMKKQGKLNVVESQLEKNNNKGALNKSRPKTSENARTVNNNQNSVELANKFKNIN